MIVPFDPYITSTGMTFDSGPTQFGKEAKSLQRILPTAESTRSVPHRTCKIARPLRFNERTWRQSGSAKLACNEIEKRSRPCEDCVGGSDPRLFEKDLRRAGRHHSGEGPPWNRHRPFHRPGGDQKGTAGRRRPDAIDAVRDPAVCGHLPYDGMTDMLDLWMSQRACELST